MYTNRLSNHTLYNQSRAQFTVNVQAQIGSGVEAVHFHVQALRCLLCLMQVHHLQGPHHTGRLYPSV